MPDPIEEVVKSLQEGYCLPFIGAGLSAWEGSAISVDIKDTLASVSDNGAATSPHKAIESVEGLANGYLKKPENRKGAPPTWYLRLCLLCMLDETAREANHDAPLSAIATLVRQNSWRDYARLLIHLFAKCKPNSLHEILARLPINSFVTTNYDGCLEAARQEYGMPLTTITNDDDLFSKGIGHSTLFKIHGNLNGVSADMTSTDDESEKHLKQWGVVLDDIQYWNFPDGRPLTIDLIRVLLACNQTVFIGYGLEDFNILEQLHQLSPFKGMRRKPILILHKATPQQVELWKKRDMEVVVRDAKSFLVDVWKGYYTFSPLRSSDEVWIGEIKQNAELAVRTLLSDEHRSSNFENFKNLLQKAAMWGIFPESLFEKCPEWTGNGLNQNCRSLFDLCSREENRWIRKFGRGNAEDRDGMWEFSLEIQRRLLEKLDDWRALVR